MQKAGILVASDKSKLKTYLVKITSPNIDGYSYLRFMAKDPKETLDLISAHVGDRYKYELVKLKEVPTVD